MNCLVVKSTIHFRSLGRLPAVIQEKILKKQKIVLHKRSHNIFKLKIGMGDPRKNVEHVTKIKEAVGDAASVRVDINQAWDEDTSLYCIEALEAGGVHD